MASRSLQDRLHRSSKLRSRPESSPSSLRRSTARRPRPSGAGPRNAGGDQVLAVDLERDRAPLEEVAVEPLGAQRPRQRQLDRVAPRELDRLRGAAGGCRGGFSAAPGPASTAARTPGSGRATPSQGGAGQHRAGPGPGKAGRPRAARPARPNRRAASRTAPPLGFGGRRNSSGSRDRPKTVPRSVAAAASRVSGSGSKPKRAA